MLARFLAGASLLAILSACATTSLECTDDTRPSARSVDGASERWCETAEGARQGTYRRFHANGQLAEAGEYAADQRIGSWRTFDVHGNLVSELPYSDGRVSGLVTFWTLTGYASEVVFRDGVADGPATLWGPSKVLLMRGSYCGGCACGAWSLYHPDGTVKAAGQTEKGRRIGEWRWYDADGRPTVVRPAVTDPSHPPDCIAPIPTPQK